MLEMTTASAASVLFPQLLSPIHINQPGEPAMRRFPSAAWFLILTVCLLNFGFPPSIARAQDETEPGPWKFSLLAGFNINQSAFSNNWSGGDKGSYAWSLKADARAERQFNPSWNWTNTLRLAYGLTAKQVDNPDDPKENVWEHPDKNDDQILLESTSRWGKHSLNPYVQFRFESQFLDKSDPRGDFNFNPLRFNETAGITKIFKKTEKSEFLTRLGFTFRQNIAQAFQDLAGDTSKTNTTNDGGLEWQSNVAFPFDGDRFTLQSRLVVFVPVYYSAKSDLEAFDRDLADAIIETEPIADYWKAVSTDWQNTLTAKISDVLSMDLYFQLVYEKYDPSTDINPDLPLDARIANADIGIRKSAQWKQTLALGISYRFF